MIAEKFHNRFGHETVTKLLGDVHGVLKTDQHISKKVLLGACEGTRKDHMVCMDNRLTFLLNVSGRAYGQIGFCIRSLSHRTASAPHRDGKSHVH